MYIRSILQYLYTYWKIHGHLTQMYKMSYECNSNVFSSFLYILDLIFSKLEKKASVHKLYCTQYM